MVQQPRVKRTDGLETIEILLSAAEEELSAVGSVKFNLGRVLKKTGVAKSSAYHHFSSRDGLIAAVEMRHMLFEVGQVNTFMRSFVESATDPQLALAALEIFTTEAGGSAGFQSRIRRASTIVAAQASPVMTVMLRDGQRELIEYLTKTLQIAVDRGLIKPRVPLEGIAHWLSSIIFGRLLVDITEDAAATQAWELAVMESLKGLFSPQISGGDSSAP